jgi:aspartyl-tRNA(Asn)/glutamyl-tRNA(Gln) amidotransferase subunit C
MISDIELKKLQKLARISFSDDEAKLFSAKLEGILDMIDKIHEVDCEGVEPLRSVCEMSQRMRDDEITVSDISEDLFKNVPGGNADLAKEIKCFVVPKVVE